MPLPGARVVPANWGEHHGQVSENAMEATVSVILGVTTPDDWQSDGEPIYGYQGTARLVYATTQGNDADAADQDIWTHGATIVLPRQAGGVPAGKQIRVDTINSLNAPTELVGRVLTIRTSSYSSYTFEQILSCVDDQSNQGGA
jgi:hypothetical protein